MTETLAMREVLRVSLQAAVPLWIVRSQQLPWAVVAERAKDCAQTIAEHGDNIQFRGDNRGATAEAFNKLAEGLAALAFTPGGVTFLGDTWIASHPEGVQQG